MRMERVMKWRPIETAPKDGGALLVWVNGWPVTAAQYCEDGYGWDEDQPGWYDPFFDVWINPTHWMPLPEPPKGGAQ